MTWLAPWTALYAAAASISLLVLLYFLKLRRRSVPVSSTFLWKRAVQDLQVNAPFQRLRKNLLLLVQLLILLAVLAALGQPVLSLRSGPARRYVLMIDRSASMSALESPDRAQPLTRLDQAKDQARRFVATLRQGAALGLGEQTDQAMVIAFDQHARVMTQFTGDKRQLLAAIDAIEPSDSPTALEEALAAARAFTTPPGEATNNRSSETAATIELFSDGRAADAARLHVAAGEVRFHRIGSDRPNLAIVAAQARRSYQKPQDVEVFATVANFGSAPVTTEVQLSLDGNIRAVRSVAIPPQTSSQDQGIQPGRASIAFALTHAEAGVFEVRQLTPDALPGDDTAWSILPPPKSLRVLLVTPGNPPLKSALASCPLARFDTQTPAEFDAADRAILPETYDVIVLDRHFAPTLPPGQYIVWGRPPADSGASADEQLASQVIVDWRSRHPVMAFVNLNSFFAAKAYKLKLPPDSDVLAEFAASPAIALVQRKASVFLLLAFDGLETSWPFEPGFVLFCHNATSYLGTELAARQRHTLPVGEAIALDALPPGSPVEVTGPHGPPQTVTADSAGVARFPGTHRVGVYRLAPQGRPATSFAVNLLDEAESRLDPANEVRFSGETAPVQQGDIHATRELWPMLLLAALLLVCAEWLLYNSRVRL